MRLRRILGSGCSRAGAAFAVLLLAFALPLAAQQASPTSPSAAAIAPEAGPAPRQTVTAAVLSDWQPEFTIDSNGEPDGFAVDILESVAKRANLDVTYRPVANWVEALDLLRRGEVDLIPNLGATADREKWIAFTRPVEIFPMSLFVRRTTGDIEAVDDLSKHVVAVVRENAAAALLASRTDAQLVHFANIDGALLALLSGQVDAVAYPDPVLWSLARRIGVEQRIRAIDPPLAEVRRGIGVRRENRALIARLDAALEGFVDSREYRAIYARWYQEETPVWTHPDFLWIVGGLLLIIAGAAMSWHYLRVLGLNRRLIAAGSAHEKALQALQASESRYRDLIEGSELAIMIAAASGTRLFVNRAFARLLGYNSSEELMALPSGNVVVAPHDRERVGRHREAVLTTGEPVSYEFDAIRKDGTLIPAQAFVQRIVWSGEYAIERTLIDLRERRRAEAAVRESEARFRHIFEAGGTGVFIRSMDGRIVDANKAMADMLGYDRSELVGKSVLDFAPAEDFESVHARVNQLSRGERDAFNIERRFVRRDGSTIWTMANISVARDPTGAPSFVVTAVRDINERKLAEEALAESEMRYRHMVERFPLGISIYGKNGDRLFVNEAFAHLLGYGSAEEVMASPRGLLLPPEDRDSVRKRKSDTFSEGVDSSPHEMRLIRKDGTYVSVQAFTRRILWAGQEAIQRSYVDLTERKQAELALRTSEERFRTVFEAGGAGMVVSDCNGHYVRVNKAFCDLLGYSAEEIIGRTPVDLAHPDERAATIDGMRALVSGASKGHIREKRYRRKDGSTRWGIACVVVAKDGVTGERYQIGIIQDITERKLAEEALAESEMRYRHAIEKFPLGIQIFVGSGDRVFANDAYAQLVGCASTRDVMAAPQGSFTPPEDLDWLRDRLLQLSSAAFDPAPQEIRIRRTNGTIVPVQAFTRKIMWAGQEAIQRTYVDLTECKQAEAALRTSEERFRTVFEAGGAGIMVSDSNWRYVRVNKAFCDLLGYSAEEIIGRTPLDLSHPDDRAATREAMRALATGASTGVLREKRYLRKDGSTLWAFACSAVAKDGATGERYQIGIVQDITERKHAEEALAESEMRYRHLFEQFPLGIQIFGQNGERLFTNDAFADLVGYASAQDVAAAPHGTFTPTADRGRLLPRLAQLSSRSLDTAPEEILFLHRSGTEVPVHAFTRKVMWAGAEAVQRTYVDLTERKLAEAALRTSEERFRTVFEASGAGMVICGMDARFQHVNKAFCDLLGYREDEIVGRSILDVTHPDDRDETADTMELLKAGAQTRRIREKRYMRKDGSTVWVIVCVVVVRHDTTGEPYHIGIIQDITERKRAEEALAESTARLVNAQRIARIGDWERDFASERLVWSDEVYRIVGVERGNIQPNYRWFREQIIHPDDRALVTGRVRHSLATGEPYSLDHRIVRPDGEVRIVHEEGEVTLGPDGEPVRFAGTVQDVTELRQAKQALEASEARFRGVFEAGGAALILSDRDGRMYEFNRAFADFLGYDEDELRSIRLYELMHPDDVASSKKQREAVFSGEIERYQAERRYLRKDGAEVWASVNVTGMPHSGNEPPILIGILQDITQRKRSEAALAEKSELLDLMRGLAESANQAGSFADAVQDYLSRVCAYTGWPVGHAFIRSEIDPDVLRPMLVWHLADPVRFERYRSATEQMVLRVGMGVPGQVIASGNVEWRTEIPVNPTKPTIRSHAALEVGFKSGFAAPVMAGTRIVAVLEFYATEVVPRDEGIVEVLRQAGTELGRVYEREQAEKDARRREEQLRQIIDNVPHWIYVKDREGRYLLANKALAAAYGCTIDDVIGRRQQDLLHDDAEAARILAHDRSVIVTGQVAVTPNGLFRVADGGVRNLRIIKMPYTTQSGELAVLGIAEDITEQRAAENERRRAQRMDALGKMTGGVAHDFNNLLTIILGNLQLLERRLKDDPLRTLAQTAERAARRGADVTRRLLAFARSQPLEPRSIDLNDMVRDMTALVERSLGSTIAIETVLANDLWQTRADPGQVENALLNLVINSRDAMPHGGRLVIETSNVTFADRARRPGDLAPGDYVAVAVRDNGTGMSEDVIARAVEPFFTTKEVGKGSGLGLSMIYGFVRQSGGDLTIESELGKGTTVRLYLPRVVGMVATGPEREAPMPVGGRETVLLVEDDPDVRSFARTALANLDYRVIEAESAAAALEMLETAGHSDLLFVDTTLPGGMNGVTLAEAVRRRIPAIGVVITSGNPDVLHDEQAAALRTAFLRKPYTQQDLATMIRSILDQGQRLEA